MMEYDRLFLGAAIIYGLSKGVLTFAEAAKSAVELDKAVTEAFWAPAEGAKN